MYVAQLWFAKLFFFFIAVCIDSYVIYACGFDRVGKGLGFAESVRITINTMFLRHICR